ncbi:hypothetical protein D9756_000593 [Leucocoprinus leucothites]|uniref:Uncharacterized protein n=1 Tax=Leucocoprinus leucothites TaxID=201217 RepID=A0A8H5GF62_9AGAR|nr:hypothetical protein D9756_000593 [Leucoagaricus leucothites]
MSLNFNDPAGIQALLNQIRTSSAWQELEAASTSTSSQPSESTPTSTEGSAAESTAANLSGSSVASLLSQLQPASVTESPICSGVNAVEERPHHSGTTPPAFQRDALAVPTKDLRLLSFEESMPILLRLSRDSAFVEEVKKIKRDQDVLERQLWEGRRSIHKKYEEKLKAAKTKASIIGGNISKHDAEMLVDAHKKELNKFDRDRALSAWDSLVSQQQLKLQRSQVPTMHMTSDPAERELQQRVLQVLISIISPSMRKQ